MLCKVLADSDMGSASLIEKVIRLMWNWRWWDISSKARFNKNIIFMIPWGHHKVIMDKCKDDQQKALFFVQNTLVNNWSRAVLLNFLDTKLFDRQGKAVTNFEYTLPPARSDLAQELTKGPYNFDFITLTKNYNEKELKDALMDNITAFLLELGNGFAFVGREYRIEIGNT